MVLLGAGASKPAGVPTATEMTQDMLRKADSTEFWRPLSAIVGALQMRQPDFERKVDVEQVMNASQLLADRLSLEFSPFVGAWHPIIDDLERKKFSRLTARSIARKAMRRPPGPRRNVPMTSQSVESAFETALAAVGRHIDSRPDGSLFRQLSSHLTGLLIEFTWLKKARSLTYFDPMLRHARNGLLTIATLNYDNTIELRSEALDLKCETGIKGWSETGTLPDVRSGIALLKLHGSVNWQWESTASGDHSIYADRKVLEVNPAVHSEFEEALEPGDHGQKLAVLFGGRNKLTAEGPFLDLLMKFKADLFENDDLIVIGYAFRDPHVNHCILRWLKSDDDRTITIVEAPSVSKDDHPFYENHADALGRRLKFHSIGAEEGIEKVFSS